MNEHTHLLFAVYLLRGTVVCVCVCVYDNMLIRSQTFLELCNNVWLLVEFVQIMFRM